MKMSVSTGFQLGSYGYNKLKRTITKEEKHLLSVYEVDQIMNNYGITYDNCIGLPLENYMTVMSEKVVSADEDENIRHTFMAFDSQCRGFLAVDDLQKAFSRVAPHIPNHTVQSCFRELDRDGDGRISYKDFDFMMKYDTKSHI
ncbi:EF-hand calcium-binding domain-containing protein 11-like isoform X2 [Ostrea edulis]|uniref:EF-hand calcium-binding domain-containing protein 11-like isoform X2 n=1 Tax=Ostrea edulis TaxID=37623 RepID=UPI002094F3F1|nr:EF-hand calcium-binding domain-containing protein 11-like isoform X2 [Ostrea edulis]